MQVSPLSVKCVWLSCTHIIGHPCPFKTHPVSRPVGVTGLFLAPLVSMGQGNTIVFAFGANAFTCWAYYSLRRIPLLLGHKPLVLPMAPDVVFIQNTELATRKAQLHFHRPLLMRFRMATNTRSL